jgi:RNA polymerase sigma-70 factor (ECF subfamily)
MCPSDPSRSNEPSDPSPAGRGGASEHPDLASTTRLLERFRGGEAQAREAWLRRYLPILKRWAHGRLPTSARLRHDTDDLVQVTLVGTLDHLESFVPAHEGAFFAYLRRALMNRIRDEIRHARRRPGRDEIPDDLADPAKSPLEQLVDRDLLERYETALAKLSDEQQEAVVMRIEMGLPYRDIAVAQGRPTENAARLFVVRALARLAEEIRAAEQGG